MAKKGLVRGHYKKNPISVAGNIIPLIKTDLDKLQEESTEMLMNFHDKSKQLISLKNEVNKIFFVMTQLNIDIGLLVAKKNNNIEQIEFFQKKIDNRKQGLFNTKKKYIRDER